LVAVLALALGLEPRFAVLAGSVAALLPSQILWSSVVLRESQVWATLAGLAVCAWLTCRRDTGTRLVLVLALAEFALIFIACATRQQTGVVAAWALPPAVLIGARGHRVMLCACALVVAICAPLAAGLGPAGSDLVVAAVPSLGERRTLL